MGYESLVEYDIFLRFQDKCLEIVGQPCTIWIPKQQVTLVYEDLTSWIEQWTGVNNISNSFSMFQARIWIEFQIKRGIFILPFQS